MPNDNYTYDDYTCDLEASSGLSLLLSSTDSLTITIGVPKTIDIIYGNETRLDDNDYLIFGSSRTYARGDD